MNYEGPIYEHLFPFYRDLSIQKIGYKLKKHRVQTKQGYHC